MKPISYANFDVIHQARAKNYAPRNHITVSDWSDLNIVLSSKSSSEEGAFRTSRNELLREPMNCFSTRSKVQDVVLMFPVQIGKTTVSVNVILYSMVENPSPIGVYLPSATTTDAWIDQKFTPILEGCEILQKSMLESATKTTSNRRNFKECLGGILFIENASNPVSAKSKSIKILIVDEVDEFASEYGSGDDPLVMLDERTISFKNAKRLYVSSTTIKGVSRIEFLFNKSTMERFYIACPHCGHEQHLVIEGLVYQKTDLARGADHLRVVYQCAECEGHIEEHQKTQLFAKGRWIAEHPERKMRGFHCNGLYYPIGLGLTWAQIVIRHESAKENGSAELKTFWNSILALPYEDPIMQKIRLHSIDDRGEPYRLRTAPAGVGMITAGVDVQKNRLAVHIIGFGKRMVAWAIDYIEIFGNPTEDDVWEALAELLNTPIPREDGKLLIVQATAIDEGYLTNETRHFVRSKKIKRPMSIRGAKALNAEWLGKPKPQDITFRGTFSKFGVMMYPVGTTQIKDEIFRRLSDDSEREPHERRIHFSEDFDQNYFGGVVSETKNPKTGRYEKLKGAKRNEPLDTMGYAFAATRHPELRLHLYSDKKWDSLLPPIDITPEWVQVGEMKQIPTESPKKPTIKKQSSYLK